LWCLNLKKHAYRIIHNARVKLFKIMRWIYIRMYNSIDIPEVNNNVDINNNVAYTNRIVSIIRQSRVLMMTIVIANYASSRVACVYQSLPYDCVPDENLFDTFERTTNLLFYTVVLYKLNNLTTLDKYSPWTNGGFVITSVGSNLIFSYISSIREMHSSFQLNNNNELNEYANYIYITILIFQLLLTTTNLARFRFIARDVFARVTIFAWFGGWIYLLDSNDTPLHLHHTFFSLLICLLNYHDNLQTRLVFFASLGIFIQGFANYKYEGLISQSNSNHHKIICIDKIIYKCDYENNIEINYYDNICQDFCF